MKAEIKCQYCYYKWTPRKEKPKQCPYCKRYLPIKKEGDNNGKT